MNHKKKRQEKIQRDIQKEYTALSQLNKEKELGVICVQYGITKEDLFKLIRDKKAVEDYEWTR